MYRKTREADPDSWPAKIIYEYSARGSTSTLRGHLEREHLDDYKKTAKEKGWKLRSQARLVSDASATSPMVPPDLFDEKTFQQYLVRFIIADDQVRFPLNY